MAVHAALCIAYAGDLLIYSFFMKFLHFQHILLVTHNQNEMLKKLVIIMSILVRSSVILLLPAIIWVWLQVL